MPRFFVENERTTRRFLKKLWREMVIDDYRWYLIPENAGADTDFLRELKTGDNIGILSEAGCPGIADPGSVLVAAAHRAGAKVQTPRRAKLGGACPDGQRAERTAVSFSWIPTRGRHRPHQKK